MEIEKINPTSIPGGPASASGKNLLILLVEDHEDTRRAMERLLKRWGHTVHCAANVATALKMDSVHEYDLLLTDLGLPDGTGIELLTKLHARHPVRAVAMSGYGMETDLVKTREAGFNEHLIKPVAMDRLKQILQQFGSA